MKNQIIKKIMAYLLVGAMVITTPMTASANELENAYSTGTDSDKDTSSGSNTNTNTSTKTESTDIPDAIEKYNLNITGIVLDKESLEFDEISTEEKSVTDTLQARVLLDDYDATGEPMGWASLDYNQKVAIENQIHWYSYDNSVAKAIWVKADKDAEAGNDKGSPKATIKATGVGQTTVCAWIEADGLAYTNNFDRPTPGDYIAEAVVTVTENIIEIEFDQTPGLFFEKRTYDLKNSTYLVTSGKKKIRATDAGAEKLIYSLEGAIPKGSTMTLSEDGILTVKKASASTTGVKFNVIATKSRKENNEFVMAESQEIKFGDAKHATNVILRKNGNDIKSDILDLGDANNTSAIVTAVLQIKKGKNIIDEVTADDGKDRESGDYITDIVTWTSKNSSIASIEDVKDKDDLTKEIVARGVGSTTITATASSGKKATLKVTVDATPTGVKIVDINDETKGNTYTGKRTTLTAVLTANDKDGNVIELPAGKTKFKWSTSEKKVATVSGKSVATVKPANLIGNAGESKTVTITVAASGKNTLKKNYDYSNEYLLNVRQSNVSNISIEKLDGTAEKVDDTAEKSWTTLVAKEAKKGTDRAFIGSGSEYQAIPVETEFKDSIGWTISGAAATVDDNGKLTPVKAGKATVSANYVTITNGKAKLNKKTVTVTVVQNASEIAFAKVETVKNVSAKDQTVTLKVNTVSPKKATCNVVNWKSKAYILKDGIMTPYEDDNIKAPSKNGTNIITKSTKNSVTVKIPANAGEGSVIKVGAYTDGGVVAYAYIYVTKKTTKVRVDDAIPNVNLGQTKSIGNVMLEFGKDADKNVMDDFANKLNLNFGEDGKDGSTTSYITEPVTYSVDKTSAKYITVDQSGNVTGIQKTGNKTATVTIKTISGKTAKVKIKVN